MLPSNTAYSVIADHHPEHEPSQNQQRRRQHLIEKFTNETHRRSPKNMDTIAANTRTQTAITRTSVSPLRASSESATRTKVGSADGTAVVSAVGAADGSADAAADGSADGEADGSADAAADGSADGTADGSAVAEGEGVAVTRTGPPRKRGRSIRGTQPGWRE